MGKWLVRIILYISLFHLTYFKVKAQHDACFQANIDSIKWKAYALSYTFKLRRMIDGGTQNRVIRDSVFNPVECDLKLKEEVINSDTVVYYFDFFRFNDSDRYKVKHNSYVGVGYLTRSGRYYPVNGISEILGDESVINGFFAERESGFVEFLKTYKGYINPWLKKEVQKRKI